MHRVQSACWRCSWLAPPGACTRCADAAPEPRSPATAGNFLRATALLALPAAALVPTLHLTWRGTALAVTSGAITSGLGYVVWYAALRHLDTTRAAVAQLSVPALAALGGVLLLGEAVTTRLLAGAGLILGGVALAVVRRSTSRQRPAA